MQAVGVENDGDSGLSRHSCGPAGGVRIDRVEQQGTAACDLRPVEIGRGERKRRVSPTQDGPIPALALHQDQRAASRRTGHALDPLEAHAGLPQWIQRLLGSPIAPDAADECDPQAEPRAREHRRGDLSAGQDPFGAELGLAAGRGQPLDAAHPIQGDLADAEHVAVAGPTPLAPQRLALQRAIRSRRPAQ